MQPRHILYGDCGIHPYTNEKSFQTTLVIILKVIPANNYVNNYHVILVQNWFNSRHLMNCTVFVHLDSRQCICKLAIIYNLYIYIIKNIRRSLLICPLKPLA